ncbi:hypothetical protein STEG23_034998, partial [Scotinomys teguina]
LFILLSTNKKSQSQIIWADGYADLLRSLCHAVYWKEQDRWTEETEVEFSVISRGRKFTL